MFILIMGVTASGKTTVGTLLSRAIKWPFFDADEFHSPANVAKMRSGVPLSDADRIPWIASLRALISEQTLRNENVILACSALKASYRDALASAAPFELIYLKADPELIRARLVSRKGHFMSPDLIKSQFLDLEEPQVAITIPASLPPEEIVGIIRFKLGLDKPDD